MLYQRLFDTSACGKLYRTEDARGQLFPAGRLFEDLATVYRLRGARSAQHGRATRSTAIARAGISIMNQRFHEGRFDELTAIDELCDFVRENCPSVQRAADCRRFSCLCQTLLAIPPEDARYRRSGGGHLCGAVPAALEGFERPAGENEKPRRGGAHTAGGKGVQALCRGARMKAGDDLGKNKMRLEKRFVIFRHNRREKRCFRI